MRRLVCIVYGGFIMIHIDTNFLSYETNNETKDARQNADFGNICICPSFSNNYLKILGIGG